MFCTSACAQNILCRTTYTDIFVRYTHCLTRIAAYQNPTRGAKRTAYVHARHAIIPGRTKFLTPWTCASTYTKRTYGLPILSRVLHRERYSLVGGVGGGDKTDGETGGRRRPSTASASRHAHYTARTDALLPTPHPISVRAVLTWCSVYPAARTGMVVYPVDMVRAHTSKPTGSSSLLHYADAAFHFWLPHLF